MGKKKKKKSSPQLEIEIPAVRGGPAFTITLEAFAEYGYDEKEAAAALKDLRESGLIRVRKKQPPFL